MTQLNGSTHHLTSGQMTHIAQAFVLWYASLFMKLTVQLKLQPTPEQADALRRTLERANEACNYISRVAWEAKTFRQFAVHRLVYQSVRETFEVAAQMAVRCVAKVADAYKLDKCTSSIIIVI